MVHRFVKDHGLVVSGQLCREMVASALQMYHLRGRWRQPEVLHVDDGLPVDAELMAPRHLLTDVQQERIVAFCLHIDVGLEDMPLAHLALTALRRGDIDGLLRPCPVALRQAHRQAGRIELRQSIVVPKHPVALARQQHRDGYLGVHLRESSRQSANVHISVLKLSQSVKILIARRVEGQRGLLLAQLVTGGGEDRSPRTVLDGQHLPQGVNVNCDVGMLLLFMTDIDPVGQFVLHPALCILHTHGIACHIGDGQRAFSKAHGVGCRSRCAQHTATDDYHHRYSSHTPV